MSLDQNLFTLHFTPYKEDPNVLDLADPSGVVHYRKHRVQGQTYEINIYDPTSDSLLITATGATPIAKTKTLQLHNPSLIVELKSTSRVSFKWSFNWEEHEFEWRKEECFMIRKPDPPVLVAVTSEPPSRLRTGSVQILDYNLNRFDIDDRKGLEIVILTALFTFQDLNDGYHSGSREEPDALSIPLLGGRKPSAVAAPVPPPRPEPRVGLARISEMQAYKGDPNEVIVEEEGFIDDYAQYCCDLLKDDAMMFITIRSSTQADVPKVLQVVEQTKRIRHKSGADEDQELFQYVVYEQEKPKGPKRINLNDTPSGQPYQPPTSLTVHMSKIDMPELKPRNATPDKSTKGKGKEKEKGKSKLGEQNRPSEMGEMNNRSRDRDREHREREREMERREKEQKERQEREREHREWERREREKEKDKDKSRGKGKPPPPGPPAPALNSATKPSPQNQMPMPAHARPRYSSYAPQPSPTMLANPSSLPQARPPGHGRMPSGPQTLHAPQPSARPLSGFFDMFSSSKR